MSNTLLNLVRDHSKARGAAYDVLRALADRIPDTRGKWSISYAGLARDTRKAKRTVRRAVATLEAMGEISVRRWRSALLDSYPNEYSILLTGVGSLCPQGGDTVTLGGDTTPPGVGSECPQGGDTVTLGGDRLSPIPNVTQRNQREPPTEGAGLWSQALEVLKTTVLPASFGMWLEGTEGVELKGNQLVVKCADAMAVQQIHRRLYFSVTKALYALTNLEWTVEFIYDEKDVSHYS